MTGRKIKEVADSLLHAEEVGNKHFGAFLQSKLVEDNKSFFELFCKARLITGNEIKKRVFETFMVVKEVCQAFGLLVNKAVKFVSTFSCCNSKIHTISARQSRITKLHYQSIKKF